MNLKEKMKNYGFWMSLTAAVILVLQTFGKTFGFSINDEAINSIVNSICGVLIVLGIISNPTSGKSFLDKPENKED
ncbi:MAG: phage holin [Clostridia bacterium]|nr:phage holin [Clostridia bacterium]